MTEPTHYDTPEEQLAAEEAALELDIEDDLRSHFGSHAMTADQSNVVEHLRAAFTEVALDLHGMVVPSRELALAQTNLEQAAMWAVKAVAMRGVR